MARFSGQDNIFRVLNFFQASQRYELFKCLLFAVVHVGLTIVVRVIALVCMRINDGDDRHRKYVPLLRFTVSNLGLLFSRPCLSTRSRKCFSREFPL